MAGKPRKVPNTTLSLTAKEKKILESAVAKVVQSLAVRSVGLVEADRSILLYSLQDHCGGIGEYRLHRKRLGLLR